MSLETRSIKQFQWVVEIDGIDSLQVQDFEFPELSVEQVKRSVGIYDVKESGRIIVGEATLKKVKFIGDNSNTIWDWFKKAADFDTEQVAPDLKRSMIVRTDDNSDVWLLEGCWVMKAKYESSFDKSSSDLTMETATISVDKVSKLQ